MSDAPDRDIGDLPLGKLLQIRQSPTKLGSRRKKLLNNIKRLLERGTPPAPPPSGTSRK